MQSHLGQAAAWAAPLFSHHQAEQAQGKQTHKLPQVPCVLWLPDYRAYLSRLMLCEATFTTTDSAERALRLGERQAHAIALELIAATGVRVELRTFHYAHELGGHHASH